MKIYRIFMPLLLLIHSFAGAHDSALYTDPSTHIDEHRFMFSEKEKNLTKREKFLVKHVKSSIAAADSGSSRLSKNILEIQGMSSSKGRNVLNNLCHFDGVKYLEIGCWKGSTFVSALFGNKEKISAAFAIDNWSEFGGPYQEFKENCNKYISDIHYNFYSHNCFSVDPQSFIKEKINVYFYDGGHVK